MESEKNAPPERSSKSVSLSDEMVGRDVHYMTTTRVVNAFMDSSDRVGTGQICFRCGEVGHVRSQCFSFKVRMCDHHARGACTNPACTYAHSEQELRQPWKPRCVRVVKQNGRFVCIGCNSTQHTFRRCPHNQDLLLI